MIFLDNINSKVKQLQNTGFGTNSSNYGGRFITKDGRPNIAKTGVSFFDSISWFHTMLNIPRWKFHLTIVLFYFLVNCFFASLYYFIGIEHLKGAVYETEFDQFYQAFFFSIQTFTTVGYGHISPSGILTSTIAAIEALSGLLSFAIATGLFYGRFSRPVAHIVFSENVIIAPYKDHTALMIRLAPYKNVNLIDVEAKITLGLHIEENGQLVNRFYSLDLEYEKVNSLTLSWTIVHPITPDSPIFGFDKSDFEKTQTELLVFIKAFDDMFSNTVVKRTSYHFSEIVVGAKFLPMFTRSFDNSKTVLHIEKLNAFEKY